MTGFRASLLCDTGRKSYVIVGGLEWIVTNHPPPWPASNMAFIVSVRL